MDNKTGLKVLACCGVIGLGLAGLRLLPPLLRPRAILRVHSTINVGPVSYSKHEEALLKRAWPLWQERRDRDISRDLLPYLSENHPHVIRFAVRALSKLESPLAEKPIAELLYQRSRSIPELTLKLALARIRSRNLKGQQRLEALCEAGGISWADLGEKSKEVNGKLRAYVGKGSPEDEVLEEIVDVLYTMRRRGKSIDGLAQGLTLNAVQKLRLKGAQLTEAQEAALILDYAMPLKAINSDGELLVDYLAALGEPAVEPVLKRLQKMKANPKPYEQGRGYVVLFKSAYLLGDQRAQPYLRHFESYPDKWISHYAGLVGGRLQQDLQQERILPPIVF